MELLLSQGWSGFLGFYFHHYSQKEDRAGDQHGKSKEEGRARRADVFGHDTGNESADWHYAHEHRGVNGHEAATHFIWHTLLNDGVGGRHLGSGGKADDEEHSRAEPEGCGK